MAAGGIGRLGQLSHLGGVGHGGGGRGLQQTQHCADPGVAAGAGDDEAVQKLRRPFLQHLAAELRHGDVAIRHQGVGLHPQVDGAARPKGVAVLGSHAHQEGVALDKAHGTQLGVHHGDGQGVGFILEAGIDIPARGLGQNRRDVGRDIEKQCHRSVLRNPQRNLAAVH